MHTYARLLDDFRSAHGAFPVSLSEAVLQIKGSKNYSIYANLLDAYGQSIRYETNGRAYVLVSYGSDRLPEATDYWSHRGRPQRSSLQEREDCAAGADVVFTDLGCLRCCGK